MNATAVPDQILAPARGTQCSQAFGYPRDYLANRFVYLTISPRARGLSIGVNLNPDKHCNFDCVYCEVDRRAPVATCALDPAATPILILAK